MAYLSKEHTSEIRNLVKETFKGQGFKFSIRNQDSNDLNIALMVSPFEHKTENYQLNEMHPDFYENDVKELLLMLNKLSDVVKVRYDRNAGDYGADYPDCNYFKSFHLGKWDKKIEYKANAKFNWDTIKEQAKQALIKRELKN